jgi:hypothetical protein
MGIFKSGKSDLSAGPDIPLNQVIAMKQQGYSNNQVIQTLQRDGYNSTQIFDAISQSEMTSGMPVDESQLNPQTQQLGQQLPPMPQSMSPMSQSSQQMPQQMQSMQQIPMAGMQNSPEELVEAIIDEKWNDLVKDINKVIEWKQRADAKIVAMEQQVADMQAQFDKLHQAIIGKVGDYDKHILEVSTQLQAMEKVFGKVLPTFIDNVSELSAITQRVKTNARTDRVERSDRIDRSDKNDRFDRTDRIESPVERTIEKTVERKIIKKRKNEDE